MSVTVALALAAALGAAPAAAHDTVVEHRGASYQVSYKPLVTTKVKTVGAASGTRMSMQKCRWSATVQVQRHIGRAGDAATADKVLPAAHAIGGERHGSCIQAGDAIRAEIAASSDAVRDHVLAVAQADRAVVLADIDAAHRLASN